MKKRIVFKFGTNVLRNTNGEIDTNRLNSFIKDIVELLKKEYEVIVVTSGAVGLGVKKLKIDRDSSLFDKQAAASVGQPYLMKLWEEGFDSCDVVVSQILLTEEDFSVRKRYLTLRNTLNRLLECNVVPIINQNDAVSTTELEGVFSDNDKLSALVASKLDADMLIILSDIDGLFDKNPKEHSDAKLIELVDKITPKIEKLATGASSGGTGGMITKLQAAKVVNNSGALAVILNGKKEGIIKKFFDGERVGTKFLPNKTLSSKARWIAYATSATGVLNINEGAKIALCEKNKSLLPVGIEQIEGEFSQGDIISIKYQGQEVARGIANYSSLDSRKIMGVHSEKIYEILGFKISDDVISKDNLVLL